METASGSKAAAATKVKPRRNLMRIVGNLLIVSGLLLMISVGGYLGFQAYSNGQVEQRLAKQPLNVAELLPPERPTLVSSSDNAAPAVAAVPTSAASAPTAVAAAGATESDPAPPRADGNVPPAPTEAASQPVPGSDKVVVDNLPLPVLNPSAGLGSNYSAPVVSEPPTRLYIPSVGIDSKIVPVGWDMIPGKDGRDSAQWNVAQYAVGHHEGTANPGQVGNVVMSGHVDWKGEVFKNLKDVVRGDQVHVFTGDREYLYIVQGTILVKEDGADVTNEMRRQNARYMDPTPDQTLTMITCWPYGVDDHRLIVIAKPYDSGLPARPDLVMK